MNILEPEEISEEQSAELLDDLVALRQQLLGSLSEQGRSEVVELDLPIGRISRVDALQQQAEAADVALYGLALSLYKQRRELVPPEVLALAGGGVNESKRASPCWVGETTIEGEDAEAEASRAPISCMCQ